MARDFAKKFYKSKSWERCRSAYIKYKGGLCERCFAKGIIKAGVIVHHKEYITPYNINNPKITTDYDNLELLCLDCHNIEHRRGEHKRYKINKDGTVKIFDDSFY